MPVAWPGFRSPEASSWLAGVQAGYNYQYRNWVFGAEVDVQGTDLTRSHNSFNPNALIVNPGTAAILNVETYRGRAEIDWFGTARGRIGVAFDRVMVYGTAGAIFANVTTSHFFDQQFFFPPGVVAPPET